MSTLIVKMEMPPRCIWTDGHGKAHACPILSELDDYCRLQSDDANEATETWDELRKGCPILGVLPDEHGDLIDRDALFLKYREQYDFIDEEDILNAKAIIAAERKDDGNI